LKPGGTLTKGSCSPIPCDGIVGAHGGESFGFGRVAAPIKLDPTGWNTFQITVRGEAMPGLINGTALTLAKMDQGRRYGEIALKIGSGDVRFKDVRMLDFIERPSVLPTEYTSPQFKKIQVSDLFYSEGIAAGDFNHDGFQDVVSGPFIYYGPDFTKSSELYPPYPLAPAGHPEQGEEQPQAGMIVHGAYSNSFISFVYDFNNDGWPDVLTVMGFGPRPTFSGHLFINPKGESHHWENYNVAPLITTEINQFVDIDGDGKPELVTELATTPNWTDNQEGYLKVDWSDPTKPWTFHPISEKGTWGGHGAGVGDINGDGRKDILAAFGWWEQPPAGSTGLWKYHEQRFGRDGTNCGPGCGGSEILVYDVNADGLPDVITSLAAHGAGLGWFEQKRDGSGGISWVKHTIMGDPNDTPEQRQSWEETDKKVAFTELHALAYADMDGDGVTDIITGKRWLSHGYTYQENDRDSPAVLYWFRTVRKPGGKVEFEPHLIHNNSGVGTFMAAVDVNGDGTPDVLTTARKGTFIFLNNLRKLSAPRP
ncbi:MAG TPA: VCBS repeat-containing protein, partial [Bryobacteraceae bacterium]|nr:VCBS repeat-containing protein [Bryobacteraceae bacterium]